MAFGAPLGLEATVSDVLIRAIRLDDGTKLFQISVPVSPGSSGGPVTTEDGKVIAIVVSGLRGEGAENLNFALPINYLRGHLAMAGGKVPVPLTQMSFERSSHSQGAGVDAVTGERLPLVVNDSLDIDWRALDGVEIYYEQKGEEEREILVRYSLSTSYQGEQLLEKHITVFTERTSYGSYVRRLWEQSATAEIRAVVNLDREGIVDVYAQRTAGDNTALSTDYHLSLRNTRVAFNSGDSTYSGWV